MNTCAVHTCGRGPAFGHDPEIPAFCLSHYPRNTLANVGFVFSWPTIPAGVRSVSGQTGWARFLAVATDAQIAAFAAALWERLNRESGEQTGSPSGRADGAEPERQRDPQCEPVRSVRPNGGPACGVGPVRAAAVARSLLAGGAVVRRRA
jgi:hypothetical protein